MGYRRSIEIAAPPDVVWAVMTDVERWPEWTPSIVRIERHGSGPLAVGATATVEPRGRPASTWTVTAVNEGRSFVWDTPAGPGLRVAAGHYIDRAEGGCRVTLAVEGEGIIGKLMSPIIRRVSKANVDTEAEGLKRRCEQRSAS
jgi:hypothetical protein